MYQGGINLCQIDILGSRRVDVNEKDTTQIQCPTYSRRVDLIILSSAQILKQGRNNEKPKKRK